MEMSVVARKGPRQPFTPEEGEEDGTYFDDEEYLPADFTRVRGLPFNQKWYFRSPWYFRMVDGQVMEMTLRAPSRLFTNDDRQDIETVIRKLLVGDLEDRGIWKFWEEHSPIPPPAISLDFLYVWETLHPREDVPGGWCPLLAWETEVKRTPTLREAILRWVREVWDGRGGEYEKATADARAVRAAPQSRLKIEVLRETGTPLGLHTLLKMAYPSFRMEENWQAWVQPSLGRILLVEERAEVVADVVEQAVQFVRKQFLTGLESGLRLRQDFSQGVQRVIVSHREFHQAHSEERRTCPFCVRSEMTQKICEFMGVAFWASWEVVPGLVFRVAEKWITYDQKTRMWSPVMGWGYFKKKGGVETLAKHLVKAVQRRGKTTVEVVERVFNEQLSHRYPR